MARIGRPLREIEVEQPNELPDFQPEQPEQIEVPEEVIPDVPVPV